MESMQQCVVFTSVSASFTLREQGSEQQKKAFSLQGTKGNGATWCGHISSPEPVIKYTFYKEISWHPSSFPFQHEGTSLLPITTKGGQGGRRITSKEQSFFLAFFIPKILLCLEPFWSEPVLFFFCGGLKSQGQWMPLETWDLTLRHFIKLHLHPAGTSTLLKTS